MIKWELDSSYKHPFYRGLVMDDNKFSDEFLIDPNQNLDDLIGTSYDQENFFEVNYCFHSRKDFNDYMVKLLKKDILRCGIWISESKLNKPDDKKVFIPEFRSQIPGTYSRSIATKISFRYHQGIRMNLDQNDIDHLMLSDSAARSLKRITKFSDALEFLDKFGTHLPTDSFTFVKSIHVLAYDLTSKNKKYTENELEEQAQRLINQKNFEISTDNEIDVYEFDDFIAKNQYEYVCSNQKDPREIQIVPILNLIENTSKNIHLDNRIKKLVDDAFNFKMVNYKYKSLSFCNNYLKYKNDLLINECFDFGQFWHDCIVRRIELRFVKLISENKLIDEEKIKFLNVQFYKLSSFFRETIEYLLRHHVVYFSSPDLVNRSIANYEDHMNIIVLHSTFDLILKNPKRWIKLLESLCLCIDKLNNGKIDVFQDPIDENHKHHVGILAIYKNNQLIDDFNFETRFRAFVDHSTDIYTINLQGQALLTLGDIDIDRKEVALAKNNYLVELKPENFFQTSNKNHLIHLDLSYNWIEFIDEKVFDNLKHLQVLDLSNNQLTEIKVDFFKSLNNLNHLDLSNNKIKRIDPGSFGSKFQLQVINLKNNKLETINKHLFAGLFNLLNLNLSYNCIYNIESDSFRDLKRMRLLFLNNNFLTKAWNWFEPCVYKLEVLNMGWNKISSIDELNVSCLKNLKALGLNNNSLSHLKDSSLQGLNKLEFVSFSSNRIYHITKNTFNNLPVLEGVLLFDNSFVSDCSWMELKKSSPKCLFILENNFDLLKGIIEESASFKKYFNIIFNQSL